MYITIFVPRKHKQKQKGGHKPIESETSYITRGAIIVMFSNITKIFRSYILVMLHIVLWSLNLYQLCVFCRVLLFYLSLVSNIFLYFHTKVLNVNSRYISYLQHKSVHNNKVKTGKYTVNMPIQLTLVNNATIDGQAKYFQYWFVCLFDVV